jgi:hypothetical protein
MQRRTFLTGLCAGSALLAAPLGAAAAAPDAVAAPAPPLEGPAPWWLVAPLVAGTHLGEGWYVRSLSAVRRGAVELTLERRSDGEQAVVHVCRRRGKARGLGHTRRLDLFLMNGANGKAVTAEGIGRAVRTAALRIAEHERSGTKAPEPPPTLMSHRARLDAYGPGMPRNEAEEMNRAS